MKLKVVERPVHDRDFYSGMYKELFNAIEELHPGEMLQVDIEEGDSPPSMSAAIRNYFPDKSVTMRKITNSRYAVLVDKESTNELRTKPATSNTNKQEEEFLNNQNQ